ncbi:MAG: patatin-like phospholipase family protein [Aminobacteriaceae bacterium]
MTAKRAATAILTLILIFAAGPASARGGVVLALSGGGTRGLAHIGVLEVLEEEGIPIAGIVGTSMGSIIGGLAASGYSSAELREVIAGLDLTNLLSEKTNPIFVPLSQDSVSPRSKVPWVAISSSGDVVGPLGGMSGVKLLERFAQLASRSQIVRFDELAIPFAAVATDLETGEKVVLRTGSLATAMRASMAIPALFDPWPVGGKLLVDGGLVSNLPVETAKELFPGYPVIAVDVSGTLKKRKDIRSLVDVIDQSLTIFTRRNVENEIMKADLVISPSVAGVPIFDLTHASRLIESGRQATMDRMAAIRNLAENAPPVAQRESLCIAATVASIRVEGATADLERRIKNRYRYWIGKPLSNINMVRASREIGDQEDVLAVDYRFEEAGENLDVIFVVQRNPELEINFGGYTTNLHPHRWVYIHGVRRDLFTDGDSLRFNAKVGSQWGIDASYLTSPEKSKSWELTLSAQNWELETNKGTRSWDRYAAGVTRRFAMGSFQAGLGYAFERVHTGGIDYDASGPTLFLTSNTLNDPTDPTSGALFHLQAWWPDMEEVLYRATYFQAARLSDNWRFYFRAGFAEGDETAAGGIRAVFLGAAEELYSYSGNPIQGERMFWWNAAFRRILMKSWWGALNTEIFGGMGFVYDDTGNRYRDAWEAGISFSVPGFLFDGKLMFLYNDEKDFKVGFFIGSPVWGHYPLP